MGGAIRGDVRKINMATAPIPTIHQHLRQLVSYNQEVSAPMREMMFGAVNLNQTTQIGYTQFHPSYEGEREYDFHKNLKSLVRGGGASSDHPRVQRSVLESLKHMPRLAHVYLNA